MARRRPTAIGLLAVALLAAALVASAGGRLGSADAATGPCVEHTRHVVKHVKRHGKLTRVVRVRHHRTCEEAPSPTAPTAPTVPTPAPPSPAPSAAAPAEPSPIPAPVLEAPKVEPPVVVPQPEPEANAVSVAADDHAHPFTYLASRTTVRPGRLTVQLANDGEDPHNMYMEKVGPAGEPEGEVIKVSTKTEPAARTTKSVEVEAGTYRMWCSFGKHAEEGMETHITVAG